MRVAYCLVAVVLCVAAGVAGAHEFWIAPATYAPMEGEAFRVQLMHGERFAGDVVERHEEKIERFEVIAGVDAGNDAPKTWPVVGRDRSRNSFAKVSEPGTHVIVYHTKHYENNLDATEFNAYLAEEGLDGILKYREAHGEMDEPGREKYSRCAKSIVVAEHPLKSTSMTGHDQLVGLPLELVLRDHPTRLAAMDELAVRVLFEGEPLAGVTVTAVRADAHEELMRVESDAEGWAVFEVRSEEESGATTEWMVTAIHMVRHDDAESAAADEDEPAVWESFWGSMTFSVPGRRSGAAASPRVRPREAPASQPMPDQNRPETDHESPDQ